MGGLLQRRAPGAAWVHLLKSFSEKRHKNGFAYVLRPHRTVYRLTSPGDVSFVWVFQKLYCYKALCFVTVAGRCKTPSYNKARKKNSWLKNMVFLQEGSSREVVIKAAFKKAVWTVSRVSRVMVFNAARASVRLPSLHREILYMGGSLRDLWSADLTPVYAS